MPTGKRWSHSSICASWPSTSSSERKRPCSRPRSLRGGSQRRLRTSPSRPTAPHVVAEVVEGDVTDGDEIGRGHSFGGGLDGPLRNLPQDEDCAGKAGARSTSTPAVAHC